MLLQITTLCGTDLLRHCNKNVTCALFRNRHFQVSSRLPFSFLMAEYGYAGVPPAQLSSKAECPSQHFRKKKKKLLTL